MKQYHDLLKHVMENGEDVMDRTGVGTRYVFGPQLVFDMRKSFPIVTTKKIFMKGMFAELYWMYIQNSTNVNDLPEFVRHWWTPWADENGDLGKTYGYQIGRGGQLKKLVDRIKSDPYSRRHILSTWNSEDVDDLALPPCHGLVVQFDVNGSRELSCKVDLRSNDLFIGAPVNISAYALLTHMIAHVCDLKPGTLVYNIGNAHIYQNHTEQVKEQLSREPLPLPTLRLNPKIKDIDHFTFEDIVLENYQHHPAIKAPIAV